MSALKK